MDEKDMKDHNTRLHLVPAAGARIPNSGQVLKAYPQFPRFLELKRKYDPNERFQSEWYRHYKRMFADP